MSKIKNSGFDQYGAEPFKQQQFVAAGVEGVNETGVVCHREKMPDVVVFPQCTDHVSACTQLCYENNVPVIPFGTGTGLEGGVVPVRVCTTDYLCC